MVIEIIAKKECERFIEQKEVPKMKSLFLRKQGATPKNKVLDFLITYQELDYSLKEIAKYSGAGYSTIKILIKKLAKDKWVVPTRKISKIILYKLNINNTEVKKFIEFYWEVIDSEIERNGKINAREDFKSQSSIRGLSASARNV